MHLGYYGLRQLMEFEHHLVALGEDLPQFVQIFMLSRHFPNVVSGAEHRAVCPNYEDGYLAIFRNFIDGAPDRADHLQGKRISDFGPVQGEPAKRRVFFK